MITCSPRKPSWIRWEAVSQDPAIFHIYQLLDFTHLVEMGLTAYVPQRRLSNHRAWTGWSVDLNPSRQVEKKVTKVEARKKNTALVVSRRLPEGGVIASGLGGRFDSRHPV